MNSPVTEPNDPERFRFRSYALDHIDPGAQSLPQCPSTAFVWPTELCGIGCEHCSFGSIRTGPPEKRELARHPETLVEWLKEAGARKLVACGGGEPLDEPDFLERAIAACASSELPFEIYTGGVASNAPLRAADYIHRWKVAIEKHSGSRHPLRVRLSVDRFHEDKIGLTPIVEWVREIEHLAPEWVLAFRAVRLANDDTVQRLATLLHGEIACTSESSGCMTLPSGRQIAVEWKGMVFERRGHTRTLKRMGLNLTEKDEQSVRRIRDLHHDALDLGRPLSAPLTVSRNVIDLEIHSDCVVHILESQAPDLRLSFTSKSWTAMKRLYYRDPILHRIAEGGLPAVVDLITEATLSGLCGRGTVPCSVERLHDAALLDWVTASAIVRNSSAFVYPPEIKAMAKEFIL